MSENMSAEDKPRQAQSELGTPSNETSSATLNKSQAISLCAAGLLVCFFLPWVQFLGQMLSGFDLQKMAANYKALWLMPCFCVITIGMGLIKESQKIFGILTGALPFFALAYWLGQIGPNLMKIFSVGAYFELGLGLVLIILSFRVK